MNRTHLILASTLTLPMLLASCGGGGGGEGSNATVDASADVASSVEATGNAVEDTATQAVEATGDVMDNTAAQAAEATGDAASAVAGGGGDDMMDRWQTIDWDTATASAQARWQDISPEELMAVQTNPEGMVALVQDRYGLSEEEARAQVEDWLNTL